MSCFLTTLSSYFLNLNPPLMYTEKNYKSVPNEIDFAVANNNFLLDATTAFVDATNSVRWRDEQCSLARRTMFVGATNNLLRPNLRKILFFTIYICIYIYMYIYHNRYMHIYIYIYIYLWRATTPHTEYFMKFCDY